MLFAELVLAHLLAVSSSPVDTPPRAGSTSAWEWVTRDFEVLMATSGKVNFAGNLFGKSKHVDLPPGYRSDFQVWVDFFRWKGLISNWLIGNTTVISRNDSTPFQLSHIRYVLTPGYRYEFETWQISGLLLHECVHTLSRPEKNGAVWWNSFQIGMGTKGAYHDHLVEAYRDTRSFEPLRVDGRVDVGQFLYGRQSVWIGQNQDFRQEVFGLGRLHMGRIGPFGFFQDVEPHLWRTSRGSIDQKWSLSTHMFLLGKHNIAGGYFRWVAYDDNPHDNENDLGQVGFEIVF